MRKLLLVAFAVIAAQQPAEGGIWDQVPNAFAVTEQPAPLAIKVLVAHDLDAVTIEVKGRYNIYDPHKNERLGTRFVGKSHLMQPLAGGLKWGEEFPGVYQICIVPDDAHITTVVDGIEYRGRIYIYDIGGTISIVNEVPVEDYIHSTLSVQIRKSQASEAVAAIAIIERTNAYKTVVEAKNPYWHVRAEDVGYEGHGITYRRNGVEEALSGTRHMALNQKASWSQDRSTKGSMLSLEEAETMAKRGDNAAAILARHFPNSTIQLMHRSEDISDIAER